MTDTQFQPEPAFITIGEIMGAWGLKGEIRIRVLTDFPERFCPGGSFLIEGVPYTIEGVKSSKDGLILKLAGIESPEEAQKLRHLALEIPESELAPLPEGSFYHFQIVGLDVYSTDGVKLGSVKQVLTTGSNDVYVVETTGKEILIPAVADVVTNIDLAAGRMTVEIIEGLLG
jgi:16S rRNA processing protein RimM